tara:strand:+ start:200 stop:427 length:228 start_codon:yes stop_codon:yes gene_type:complete
MSYEILLKQNLHGDEILYVLKYSDTKNYSFIFTEEQTQETLNNLVEQEVNREIEYAKQQKEIEEKQAEAIEILSE